MAGGYWLPTEAAGQLGVSVRTVNRLVAASRNAVRTGEGSWGGQEGEDRRATCLMVRSVVT
jgi:hypothetical protein